MSSKDFDPNTTEETTSPTTEPNDFDMTPEEIPKNAKHPVKKILALVLAILLIAGAAGAAIFWYLHEKDQPRQTVIAFMESMKASDLTTMRSMVQSSDFSVLNNSDIENPVYQEFFHQMNEQITYHISNVRLNFQEGAAEVTVHVQYADGTEILQQTISDFVRSSSMDSDETPDPTATPQELLSSLLLENYEKFPTVYSEADVIYPLVQTGDTWKIASLDEQTVRIMSSNCNHIQDDVNPSGSSEDSESESEVLADTESPSYSRLDISADTFAITVTDIRTDSDYSGAPCLLIYYDYTNLGETNSSALLDVHLKVYQHGNSMKTGIPETGISEADNYYKEVTPGKTISVCQIFELDDSGDVTIQVDEAYSLGIGTVHSQTISIK